MRLKFYMFGISNLYYIPNIQNFHSF